MTDRPSFATHGGMNVVHWFDPENDSHLRAWKHLSDTGSWPVGFIPEGTLFPTMWQSQIAFKMADKWVAHKAASSESGRLSPPTREEVAEYRDLFRRELDKRMDTSHPSASPSTEAHQIALCNFVEKRNAAKR